MFHVQRRIGGSNPSAFKNKMIEQLFYLLFAVFFACIEPFGLVLITFFFAFRLFVARFFFAILICIQFPRGFKYFLSKLFLAFFAYIGILICCLPFVLLFFDFRRYALLYIYFLNTTIYTLFLEDIFFLFFFCFFLYGLHKNSSFIKKEYKELLNILNRYIFPYLKKRSNSFLIFINNDIFLRIIQWSNLFKNRFIVQIKQTQWFNDLVTLYRYFIRRHLPRIKSWFNFKK
jgi:hypothetical protein